MHRAAARLRGLLRLLVSIGAFSIGFAAVFFVGMCIHSFGQWPDYSLAAMLHAGALFSVFGALYGTVVVLDRTSGLQLKSRVLIRTFHLPKLRVALGAIWGGLAVYLAQHLLGKPVPLPPLILGATVGALLGWFGWRWARHVDF